MEHPYNHVQISKKKNQKRVIVSTLCQGREPRTSQKRSHWGRFLSCILIWGRLRSFFIVWVFRPGCFFQTTTEKHPGLQNLRTLFLQVVFNRRCWKSGVWFFQHLVFEHPRLGTWHHFIGGAWNSGAHSWLFSKIQKWAENIQEWEHPCLWDLIWLVAWAAIF